MKGHDYEPAIYLLLLHSYSCHVVVVVQSYSPGVAHMYPRLMYGYLGPHDSAAPKQHLDRFSRFGWLVVVTNIQTLTDRQTYRQTDRQTTLCQTSKQ